MSISVRQPSVVRYLNKAKIGFDADKEETIMNKTLEQCIVMVNAYTGIDDITREIGLPIDSETTEFYDLIYCENLHMFICACRYGIMYLEDGKTTWEKVMVWDAIMNKITYDGNTIYGFPYYGYHVYKSTDGKNWERYYNTPFNSNAYTGVRGMASHNGLFVAVLNRSAMQILKYSPATDSAWQIVLTSDDVEDIEGPINFRDVCWGKDKFVAITFQQSKFYYSYNGIKWYSTTVTPGKYYKVRYGKGNFVAINSSRDKIVYSDDGITWNEINIPLIGEYYNLCFTGNMFVASKYNSKYIIMSNDGKDWESVELLDEADKSKHMAYGNGNIVMLSDTYDANNKLYRLLVPQYITKNLDSVLTDLIKNNPESGGSVDFTSIQKLENKQLASSTKFINGSFLSQSGYTITLPNVESTLATISDIPNLENYATITITNELQTQIDALPTSSDFNNLQTALNGKASTSTTDSLQSQINALPTKSTTDDLQDQIDALPTSSDISNLQSQINGKASTTTTDNLQTQINALPTKTTTDNLQTQINNLPTKTITDNLQTQIDDLPTSTDISNLQTQINDKASTTTTDNLQTQINGKASTTTTDNLQTQINALPTSSDISDLQDQIDDLPTSTDISNLQTQINNKASSTSLSSLESRVAALENATPLTISDIFPIGFVLFMYSSANPNNMFPGTTWSKLNAGYYIKTTTNSQEVSNSGGSNTTSAIMLNEYHLPFHRHSLTWNLLQPSGGGSTVDSVAGGLGRIGFTASDGSGNTSLASFSASTITTRDIKPTDSYYSNLFNTTYAGSSNPHDHTIEPYYILLIAWRRTE